MQKRLRLHESLIGLCLYGSDDEIIYDYVQNSNILYDRTELLTPLHYAIDHKDVGLICLFSKYFSEDIWFERGGLQNKTAFECVMCCNSAFKSRVLNLLIENPIMIQRIPTLLHWNLSEGLRSDAFLHSFMRNGGVLFYRDPFEQYAYQYGPEKDMVLAERMNVILLLFHMRTKRGGLPPELIRMMNQFL